MNYSSTFHTMPLPIIPSKKKRINVSTFSEVNVLHRKQKSTVFFTPDIKQQVVFNELPISTRHPSLALRGPQYSPCSSNTKKTRCRRDTITISTVSLSLRVKSPSRSPRREQYEIECRASPATPQRSRDPVRGRGRGVSRGSKPPSIAYTARSVAIRPSSHVLFLRTTTITT